MLPDWLTVALTVLNALGLMAAGVYGWWAKTRDREAARVSKPYKELFKELQAKLEKAQEGFALLQEEHIVCREQLARLEERIAVLEKRP